MSIPIVAAKRVGFIRKIPPVEVSRNIAKSANSQPSVDTNVVDRLWPIAHVAYGAACGVIFTRIRPVLPESTVAAGAVFGGAVWGVSYGGYLPMLRLYPDPTRDAEQRILTMTFAHLVFGVSLAYADRLLQNPKV